MSLRIMAVGDMHLGRRPRRLPEGLSEHRVDLRSLTPATAWQRTVEVAIEKDIDVVLLAGDVVESLDDRFEAYGHLDRGVQRLVDAGVHVIGVTGNHDVIALPRLAKRLPGFRLLGVGGKWEFTDLELRGERLRIVGWSFPRKHHSENPLVDFPMLPTDGVCTLGLLHCDLDVHKSQYAPVLRSELERIPCDAWLLGHIHAPSKLTSPRPIGYLGSVAGLDPGEAGLRGPWLIEARGDRRVEVLEQVNVSSLRYEREVIDCQDWGELGDEALADRLEAAIYNGLSSVHRRLSLDSNTARVVAVRLILRGRVERHLELVSLLRSLPFEEMIRPHEGVLYYPEKVVDELEAAINLRELAGSADPPGLLARKLLVLENAGAESAELVELVGSLEREVSSVGQKNALWSGLPDVRVQVRERALQCGMRALEGLLQQRAGAGNG